MKIGEVIRKYRKEKQYTQEEMAGYLGVTAPAVNKWENGNSCPDITLLAPIARLLGISTDTLLSYKEDLTDLEMNQILEVIAEIIKSGNYEQAFCEAQKKIREYPNCGKLILMLAQILDGYRFILGIEDAPKYDDRICDFYGQALTSSDAAVSQSALVALFQFYMTKEDYEKAQEYLDQLPQHGFSPKKERALLCRKQGKTEEAYQMFEELIYSGYMDISMALNGILGIALEENDIEKAKYIVEKSEGLARLLEMEVYVEASPGLGLALHLKDKEETLRILENVIQSVEHIGDIAQSRLYEHMTFSKVGSENMAFMLEKGLEQGEDLDFLKGNERFEKLCERLKALNRKKTDY